LKEKSLELQESMTRLEAHSAALNVGHSDLGGKVRVLCSVGILDFDLHLAAGWKRKKEEVLRTSRANLKKNLMCWAGRRSAELRWTPVDARDRAGPATLDSHGGGATRRLGVTGP
jgi:hypothetical protein